MLMKDFPKDVIGKVTDHPIMLAEKLVSTYAVPLFFNDVPKGVLLIGNRKTTSFSEEYQQQVRESAQSLEQILKAQKL
jgi:nitrogen regulatory protein A